MNGVATDGVKAVWETEQKEVVFAGQEVAAVAATTSERAGDALARIEVDWEVLPFAVDVEDAMADGAPAVLPRGPNVREDRARRLGDPERAFADAANVVEARFRTRVQTHSCLETQEY